VKYLSLTTTDDDLISFIDGWAGLLERGDYDAAFSYTDHIPEMGWSATLIREVIKAYGEASSDQCVTVQGRPTDVTQRKVVDWWSTGLGQVWYDLNINGKVSDLTATFDLERTNQGLIIKLNDIHVM